MAKLGDFLKSINTSKTDLMSGEEAELNEKDYVPFIINRSMSYFPDTVLLANSMNMFSTLPKHMQYQYFRLATRKGGRFSKWHKEYLPKKHELVKDFYGLSDAKTKDIIDLITKEQLKAIKERLFKGGPDK